MKTLSLNEKTHFFILTNIDAGFCSSLSVILSYKVAFLNTNYDILTIKFRNTNYSVLEHLFYLKTPKSNHQVEEVNYYGHITDNFIKKYNLSPYPDYYNTFRRSDSNIYLWCSPKFYFDDNIQKIRNDYNKAFNTFKINDLILKKVEEEIILIGNINSTLAIFIRSSLHYSNINFNEMINGIINELISIHHKYEKIVVFTQVIEVVECLKNTEIKHKFYFKKQNNMYSYYGDWDINNEITETFIKKEFEDCFIDLLIASKCKYLIGGVSNMMFTTLIINPNIEFKLFDVLKNINGC